jgi:hypothetical protein
LVHHRAHLLHIHESPSLTHIFMDKILFSINIVYLSYVKGVKRLGLFWRMYF